MDPYERKIYTLQAYKTKGSCRKYYFGRRDTTYSRYKAFFLDHQGQAVANTGKEVKATRSATEL